KEPRSPLADVTAEWAAGKLRVERVIFLYSLSIGSAPGQMVLAAVLPFCRVKQPSPNRDAAVRHRHMSDELFPYYERELLFIRQLSQEFAREYPAAAGRLLL